MRYFIDFCLSRHSAQVHSCFTIKLEVLSHIFISFRAKLREIHMSQDVTYHTLSYIRTSSKTFDNECFAASTDGVKVHWKMTSFDITSRR